jgi:hypothetical protein
MKEYDVFFSIYGKKMKSTVKAETEEQARNCVRNKINFDKIKEKPIFSDVFKNKYGNIDDLFKGIFK